VGKTSSGNILYFGEYTNLCLMLNIEIIKSMLKCFKILMG